MCEVNASEEAEYGICKLGNTCLTAVIKKCCLHFFNPCTIFPTFVILYTLY